VKERECVCVRELTKSEKPNRDQALLEVSSFSNKTEVCLRLGLFLSFALDDDFLLLLLLLLLPPPR
jgi:hypothetical protein